jgi:predicted nucleotidyltransferase
MSGKTALEMDPIEWQRYHPFGGRKGKTLQGKKTVEARKLANRLAKELRQQFGAQRVVLFGSLAREELTAHSDIDLAVWGIPPEKFYSAVAFVTGASISWSVDLIDGDDCPPALLQSIETEGIEL